MYSTIPSQISEMAVVILKESQTYDKLAARRHSPTHLLQKDLANFRRLEYRRVHEGPHQLFWTLSDAIAITLTHWVLFPRCVSQLFGKRGIPDIGRKNVEFAHCKCASLEAREHARLLIWINIALHCFV